MPDPSQSLKGGYRLEEYRIERVLGGGSFSFVYLAYHIETHAKVVIKEYFPHDHVYRIPGGRVLPVSEPARTNVQLGIKRFFNEGMALAKVKHPNIINVSNFFRANNTVFMVMDFEEGRDLRRLIKKSRGRLNERFMLTVFPPVMRGLKALHEHGFLHLDIKPANILLRSSGEPLLLDFGAVQQVNLDNAEQGVQTLTHGYAPPEQYTESHLGPWSDIYSLGMTMRVSITGESPPESPKRFQNETLQPVARIRAKKYSRCLLEAIDWATELRYERRPQTVDELFMAMTDQDRLKPETAAEGWIR